LCRADGQRTQKSINTACLAARFRGRGRRLRPFCVYCKTKRLQRGEGESSAFVKANQNVLKWNENGRAARKCIKKRQNAKDKFEQILILFPAETDFPAWPIEANRRFGYNLDTKIKPNCAGCRNLHMRKRV